MTTTEGIEAVFLETHNWGRSAKFFQALGFELEFETDHDSGQLRNGDGPYVFIAEVPEDRGGRDRSSCSKVADADAAASSIRSSRSSPRSPTPTTAPAR